MALAVCPPMPSRRPAILSTPQCARPPARNAPQVADVKKFAQDNKVNLRLIELDVPSEKSIEAAIHQIVAEQRRLDVLMHNAGAYGFRTGGSVDAGGNWPNSTTSTCSAPSGIKNRKQRMRSSMGRRSHGLTEPDMRRIAVQPWMPSHQEIKRTQLLRRFYEA